ncbi:MULTISPECIES: preprotein translocase subunit SecE [unclassified Mycoplasma]|uniref:preprotein translocase subunit SecE n=1 Tax=unclassified Mycoplasma TaxID=2683645 RepID=UPI00211CB890|nr:MULTISPECIES: preprotein translocase subunit SecE [unclassified Mycoplasma]UUM20076.1 preprotein translocase subunit SecE [Mycoplasma sp. 1578d]UUM25056.1 preprotein translocase subunit SecE [Mycoplasma sp. 3686d]
MNKLFTDEEIEIKPPKHKRYFFRKIVKEIKRVKWPSNKTNVSSFIKILIFTLIIMAFVFLVSFVFTQIWASNNLI